MTVAKTRPGGKAGRTCKRMVAGERHGSLVTVERVGTDRHGMTLWACDCSCGSRTTVAANNLRRGHVSTCNGPAHRVQVGYPGAHKRVRDRYGSASGYPCASPECGEPGAEWAYDGSDPLELHSTVRRGGYGYRCAYSLDPSRYRSLCVPHHRERDRAWTAFRRAVWSGVVVTRALHYGPVSWLDWAEAG